MYASQENTADEIAVSIQQQDTLVEALLWIAQYHGQPVSRKVFLSGLPIEHRLTPQMAGLALERVGIASSLILREVTEISPWLFPAILLRHDGGAFILSDSQVNAQGETLFTLLAPEAGNGQIELSAQELKLQYSGYALLVKPRPPLDNRLGEQEIDTSEHWLWGTLWRFRRYYGNAVLAAMLINVLALAGTFFTMNVYDRVVPNQAFVTLWSLATGVMLAIVFEFIARNIRAWLLDMAGKKADLIIGSRLFRHAMSLRMEHKPASSGSFANQLREYETVRDFVSSATLVTLSDLPFVLLFTIIIAGIGGPLAFIPLAAIPLIIIVSLLIQWPLARLMKENLREGSIKQGILIESVDGLESLKAAGGEGFMQLRWDRYSALISKTSMKSRLLSGLASNSVSTIQQLQTVALVCWGVYLIADGDLSMGGLIGTVILSSRITAPLGQIVGLAVRFQQARAAMKSINELMRKPTDRDRSRRYLAAPQLSGTLTLKNISFSWPASDGIPRPAAISNVSLTLNPGERVAILGRIGSGKSTLLRLMARLYQANQGQILMDGLDALQIDPADWRAEVGFVGQDSRLFYGTLRENIQIGHPGCSTSAFLSVCRLTGLDQMAQRHPLGYEMPIGENGQGLSGGQQQLVVLARCLLAQPKLLLMDEPTSAMDTQTETLFLKRLAAATHHQTLVVVTHRFSVLNQVDRIIVMEEGKVVLDGPKADVLARLSQNDPQEKSLKEPKMGGE